MKTTNEDAGLLACPFCSSTNCSLSMRVGAWKFAYCPDCLTEGPAMDNDSDAIAAWNRRAPSKVQVEAVRATWQPIETAPKDGTKIVIAVIDHGVVFDICNGHFEILEDDEEDGPWDICDGEPVCSYIGREAGTYFCCWLPGKEWERGWKVTETFEYTHWMPLPEAPDAAAASGGEKV